MTGTHHMEEPSYWSRLASTITQTTRGSRLDCQQFLYSILGPVDMCSASKSPSTFFTPQSCLPAQYCFQYLYCIVSNIRWLENSVSRANSLHFWAAAHRLQVSHKPSSTNAPSNGWFPHVQKSTTNALRLLEPINATR